MRAGFLVALDHAAETRGVMRRKLFPLLVILLALPGIVAAQEFPSRPVRIIVPFVAGGISDVLARAISQTLSETWRQPVVTENRPGAGGVTGTEVVAKAQPDGHTLLLINAGGLSAMPGLFPNLSFDIQRDLTAVTMLAISPYVIAVHPSVPATSLRELLDLSRAQPGKLNFASGGNGTIPHLAGILLQEQTGTRWVHFPYRGDAAILPDLLAGRMNVTMIVLPIAMTHIRSGALRPLAVTSATRSSQLPDVSTAVEAGAPGFVYGAWQGMFVTGGTPAATVAQLHTDIARAMESPLIRERLASLGAEPFVNRPEVFQGWVREESAKWSRVIRSANVRPD
jgi:tripartite-type tricarboxylate transporter receptor subunit TctC